jgi:hypothetical protein
MRACEDCGFRPALAESALCAECSPAAPKQTIGKEAKSEEARADNTVEESELDRLRNFGSALWLTFVLSFIGAVASAVGYVGAESPESSVLWLVFIGLFSLIANATLLAGIISSVMYRHSRVLLEGLGRFSQNGAE